MRITASEYGPVWRQLLIPGQTVEFSGKFVSSGETGCIKEESLTLRGKIEDPEFTFKFASVGNDHAPTNMEDNEPSETEASGATVDSRQSSARPPDLGIASGSVQ
jgi:hypothetical protein